MAFKEKEKLKKESQELQKPLLNKSQILREQYIKQHEDMKANQIRMQQQRKRKKKISHKRYVPFYMNSFQMQQTEQEFNKQDSPCFKTIRDSDLYQQQSFAYNSVQLNQQSMHQFPTANQGEKIEQIFIIHIHYKAGQKDNLQTQLQQQQQQEQKNEVLFNCSSNSNNVNYNSSNYDSCGSIFQQNQFQQDQTITVEYIINGEIFHTKIGSKQQGQFFDQMQEQNIGNQLIKMMNQDTYEMSNLELKKHLQQIYQDIIDPKNSFDLHPLYLLLTNSQQDQGNNQRNFSYFDRLQNGSKIQLSEYLETPTKVNRIQKSNTIQEEIDLKYPSMCDIKVVQSSQVLQEERRPTNFQNDNSNVSGGGNKSSNNSNSGLLSFGGDRLSNGQRQRSFFNSGASNGLKKSKKFNNNNGNNSSKKKKRGEIQKYSHIRVIDHRLEKVEGGNNFSSNNGNNGSRCKEMLYTVEYHITPNEGTMSFAVDKYYTQISYNDFASFHRYMCEIFDNFIFPYLPQNLELTAQEYRSLDSVNKNNDQNIQKNNNNSNQQGVISEELEVQIHELMENMNEFFEYIIDKQLYSFTLTKFLNDNSPQQKLEHLQNQIMHCFNPQQLNFDTDSEDDF